jgi:hypothetical protein
VLEANAVQKSARFLRALSVRPPSSRGQAAAVNEEAGEAPDAGVDFKH